MGDYSKSSRNSYFKNHRRIKCTFLSVRLIDVNCFETIRKKSFCRMQILKKIVMQSIRNYHRPPDRRRPGSFFMKFVPESYKKSIEQRWMPVAPDGSIRYLNALKLSALLALVNLNVYQIYQMKQAVANGELTASDYHWDKYGIDSGFRSVTKDKPPACGEDCIFSSWIKKL